MASKDTRKDNLIIYKSALRDCGEKISTLKGHHLVSTHHPCTTNCISHVYHSVHSRRNADPMRLSSHGHALFRTRQKKKKKDKTTNDTHNCLNVVLGTPGEASAVFPAKLNLKSADQQPPPASNAISTAVKRLLERALISKYHHLALRGWSGGRREGGGEEKNAIKWCS